MTQSHSNGLDDPMNRGAWSLFEMSYVDAQELLTHTKLGMIVVGSTEQHGPHLPLGTDAMGAMAVARKVRERIPIVIAPPVLVGYSPYHMSWAGGMTLRSETLLAVLSDYGTSLVKHGIRNIVFLNGHGGNKPIIDIAASDLQLATGARALVINYPYLNESVFGEHFDLAHAGRFETAAVMAYNGQLVHIDRATDPSSEASYTRQTKYRGIGAYPIRGDFREILPTGWSGKPHDATKQDAIDLAEKMADRVVALIEDEFPTGTGETSPSDGAGRS